MTVKQRAPRAGPSVLRGPVRIGLTVVLLIASVPGLATACAPGGGTAPPATATAAGTPDPDASGTPRPKPTTWPTNTVEAAIALGAADNDFTKLAMDVVAAVSSEDPQRILTVMNGALEFLTENQKNVPRLQAYAFTKSVGDRLAVAYATMIEGATQVRDALYTGDAEAIETGLTTFFDGNKAYVAISPDLGDLADQAVFMKRQLLR